MAASDSQLAAGRRLAADVRAIRRKHGIDLKEVLDATRLADDVIEQLEENALVQHPAFNRVYLRSLFGVYGEAIGVRKEDMVAAVEEVFDGHYVGALARDYLGITEEDGTKDDVRPVSEESDKDTSSDQPDLDIGVDETPDVHPGEDPGLAMDEEPTEEHVHEIEQTALASDGDQPQTESVWSGLAGRQTVLLPNMSGTALVVIAGIAFVSLLWFSISTVMNLGSGDDDLAVVEDTSAVEEVFRIDPVILPESLEVAIVAFNEPLDPIRITADRDFRKPYWVELLDTHRVVITERIRLEREADHTRVLVDGFLLPETWLLSADAVEITRDRVQTWLDSLVTEGIAPQRQAPSANTVFEIE